MESSLVTLLASLTRTLREAKVDHALIGAFALMAHGYVRATRDLDLIARGHDQERIVSLLVGLGFTTLHRSPGYSNHLHAIGQTRVDFVYVSGATADEIFAAARAQDSLGGLTVPVVTPEHLAALKLFAIRNNPDRKHQELADIERLLALPRVDRSAVRAYFERYGLADLWPEVERHA